MHRTSRDWCLSQKAFDSEAMLLRQVMQLYDVAECRFNLPFMLLEDRFRYLLTVLQVYQTILSLVFFNGVSSLSALRPEGDWFYVAMNLITLHKPPAGAYPQLKLIYWNESESRRLWTVDLPTHLNVSCSSQSKVMVMVPCNGNCRPVFQHLMSHDAMLNCEFGT